MTTWQLIRITSTFSNISGIWCWGRKAFMFMQFTSSHLLSALILCQTTWIQHGSTICSTQTTGKMSSSHMTCSVTYSPFLIHLHTHCLGLSKPGVPSRFSENCFATSLFLTFVSTSLFPNSLYIFPNSLYILAQPLIFYSLSFLRTQQRWCPHNSTLTLW